MIFCCDAEKLNDPQELIKPYVFKNGTKDDWDVLFKGYVDAFIVQYNEYLCDLQKKKNTIDENKKNAIVAKLFSNKDIQELLTTLQEKKPLDPHKLLGYYMDKVLSGEVLRIIYNGKNGGERIKIINLLTQYNAEVTLEDHARAINDFRSLSEELELAHSCEQHENLYKLLDWHCELHLMRAFSKKKIACFSEYEALENTKMWSYYGDSHKGVCLLFDAKNNPEDGGMYINNSTLAEKVVYKEFSNESRPCYFDMLKYNEQQYKEFMLQKNLAWQDECERRIFSNTELIDYEPSRLIGVVFGVRTSLKDKHRILQCLEKKRKSSFVNCKFYQAYFNYSGQGSIKTCELLSLNNRDRKKSSTHVN